MENTKIDWCDSTWNPVTGCLHECEYCYARGIAERFGGKQKYSNIFDELEPMRGSDGKALAYPHSFSPTFHRYRMNDYIRKKGRNIFVCSMADLFGGWVPDGWIKEVFGACQKAPQHNYLFLTKNPRRYCDLQRKGILPQGDNYWFGTTYDHGSKGKYELTGKQHVFVSLEPLLQDIGADIGCIEAEWIIVGAETGRRKDKVVPKREWIENILHYCEKEGIPLFMKSSLVDIWGEPLIQDFPRELTRKYI